ncbi:hypothetical protein WR25_02403 isoform B [Diploscapter pachys]|uniref:Cation efflux protein transmembrane domain-containing protein n=2 Tax=Diploscapter pachys TaxID=2018661 RepID=A0A2A2JP21_9BILA|nr:hypothetical protein WR25_02403 isoform B [Diploscapter pachys]
MVPSPHEQDSSDSTSNSKKPSANFTDKMSSPLISKLEASDDCGHNDMKIEEALNLSKIPLKVNVPQQKHNTKLMLMISMTLGFFFIELITGFLCRSIALLADAYHMLSDVMSLCVALLCVSIANKVSSSSSFGWVRAEVIGAMFNGVFLLTVCFNILMEALGRIVHPRMMKDPLYVLIVGIIGLCINVIGMCVFSGHDHGGDDGGHGHSHAVPGLKTLFKKKNGHSHSHSHKHDKHDAENGHCHSHSEDHEHHHHENLELRDETAASSLLESTNEANKKGNAHSNMNIRGVYLHIVTDAIGSVIVIITATIAMCFPDTWYLAYLDPLLSLTLASMMSFSAWGLVNKAAKILLRETPKFIDSDRLKATMKKLVGVGEVSDIEVWTLVGQRNISTAYVDFCRYFKHSQNSVILE